MRPHALGGFQMFGMHKQADKIIAIHVQAKENPDTHVVDAALHGTVHSFGMIGIVALWSGRVQFFVALLIVGLLEQDIGADTGFF